MAETLTIIRPGMTRAMRQNLSTMLMSELNFRANIYGFKQLGVEWILSASAVGSLKEELRPLDIVIPELQSRGIYKTSYDEGSLRNKLFGDGDRLPARHAGASFRTASGSVHQFDARTTRSAK